MKKEKAVKGNLFSFSSALISTFYNICVLILQISFFLRFQTVLLYVVFTVNLRNIARRPEN